MRVLGIDPGPERSAWVLWDGERVCRFGADENLTVESGMRILERQERPVRLAMERPQAFYGPGVKPSPQLMETAFEAGTLYGAWPDSHTRLYLRFNEVSRHHTGRSGRPEPEIRAALLERIGPVGTKKNPGPLYGLKVKDHHFSALAVAVCAADRLSAQEPHA